MQTLSDEELVVWDRYAAAALVLIGELYVSSAKQQSRLGPNPLGQGLVADEVAANAAKLADALLQERRKRSG